MHEQGIAPRVVFVLAAVAVGCATSAQQAPASWAAADRRAPSAQPIQVSWTTSPFW
jgi:photosystem II stability/assembly factor-like uncharacterized protein